MSLHQVKRFLTKVYRGVGSARARRMEALLDSGEWTLLQKERISDPSVYQNHIVYLKDTIVVDMTRKLLLPGDNRARKEKALETFWQCEAECYRTNGRLRRFLENGPYSPPDLRVSEFIAHWRKILNRRLGPIPHQLTPRFSRGSTLSDFGRQTTIPDKLMSERTLYKQSYAVYLHTVQKTILDAPVMPTYVPGNRFFTVPKDSEKDRGCCVEASGNIMCQLAVGHALKARYEKAYGVDLRQAKPLHMQLAREASVKGHLATIDLSNASDTVSRDLIRLVLPPDWFALLNSLRAPTTELPDGRIVRLEKFSSMGNGFTFELETFLFRSLMEAVGCESAWTFGDDMICPTNKARDVIAALRFFGFTPNERKTFCNGPFRESCGGDYFQGPPVRGHFLETIPSSPQNWLALANGLRRVDPHLRWLRAAWRYCIEQLPTQWRVFGPSHLGDICLHIDDPKPIPHLFKGEVLPVPAYRVMRPVGKRKGLWRYPYPVAITAAALTLRKDVSPRDSITGYKSGWVPAHGVEAVYHGYVRMTREPRVNWRKS